MSVDECTYRKLRTQTVRGVRTPPTLGVHSRTLPTVYLHFWTLRYGVTMADEGLRPISPSKLEHPPHPSDRRFQSNQETLFSLVMFI